MLSDQIQSDLKAAMLAKDELKTSVLRMLLSELKYANMKKGDEGSEDRNSLPDTEVIAVVQREIKKRREAVGFYKDQRPDLAAKEESELAILQDYLPSQMSDEELTALVQEAMSEARGLRPLTETGALTMADMGAIMKIVMPKVGQAAEPGRVSAIVKEKLSA